MLTFSNLTGIWRNWAQQYRFVPECCRLSVRHKLSDLPHCAEPGCPMFSLVGWRNWETTKPRRPSLGSISLRTSAPNSSGKEFLVFIFTHSTNPTQPHESSK